jgi:ParB family chromosome partitioning protein
MQQLSGPSVLDRLRERTQTVLNRGAREIAIELIDPDPDQPRKTYDQAAAEELAASVREQGIVSPILVTPKGDRFRIVFGERRYRAALEVGLTTIPCVIREQLEPLQILLFQLTENLQRADPRPLEVAACLAKLEDPQEGFALSRAEIGRLLGRSPSWVSSMLSLLDASGPARDALEEGLIRDPETTRLFRQLPEASKDALLEEARSRNQPIRRSEVRRQLRTSPSQPPSPDEESTPPSPETGAAPGPFPESTRRRAEATDAPVPQAPKRGRGRPARQGPPVFQLPALTWNQILRIFESVGLSAPTDPSELEEAFSRLCDALS